MQELTDLFQNYRVYCVYCDKKGNTNKSKNNNREGGGVSCTHNEGGHEKRTRAGGAQYIHRRKSEQNKYAWEDS